MANTLTNLIPDIFSALDVVSRERVGFITACHIDADASRAASGQTVYVDLAPAATAEDITPGTTPPDTGDQVFTTASITIASQRAVPFRWTGDEQKGVTNPGPGYRSMQARQIAQALRTLTNEIEADLAELYVNASRAFGTAATTPFGTANEFDDAAEVLRILEENGAPPDDLQLVVNPAAMAKLRGFQSGLFHINEAGTDEFLRQGYWSGGLMGLQLRTSAQVQTHTKGTATGFDANGGEPVGETDIVLDGGNSGTVLNGDIVTFAGDANKYVVADGSGVTGGTAGTLVIAEPGLKSTLADTVEMTIGGTYAANMAFHRQAIVLAARQPYLPEEGDMAADRMTVTDPVSGLVFEFAIYQQYRRVRYEVALAWGAACVKPEHTAILLG